jgi:Type II secretion system (T2SS), protein G
MRHSRGRFGLVGVALALAAALCAPAARADDDAYLRITDDEKAQKVSLDVAVRAFEKPGGAGPLVYLVGVVHIGDQQYYDELQTFLDAQGLVMFEGVKPGAIMPVDASADDASRIKLTKQRVRMLGVAVEQYRQRHKALPTGFEQAIGDDVGPSAQMIRAAMVDGWGHAITLAAVEGAKPAFDVVSLGKDGAPGGEGSAGDIKLSDMKPISKDEASAEEGIQVKLAKALRLEFQLAAMDYTKANWRNSDMTVEELSKRLGGSGESADDGEGKQSALMGMLSGQSFAAKLVGVLLKMIELSPTASSMTKLMMLEMLGHADELMEAQGSSLLGVDGAKLMKVLIDDRNEVVLEDLRKVVQESPELESIAVFYGAGHLPKMQKSLIETGYVAGETAWRTAITVDLATFPGGAAMAKMSREMIRKQLEAQIGKKK